MTPPTYLLYRKDVYVPVELELRTQKFTFRVVVPMEAIEVMVWALAMLTA